MYRTFFAHLLLPVLILGLAMAALSLEAALVFLAIVAGASAIVLGGLTLILRVERTRRARLVRA